MKYSVGDLVFIKDRKYISSRPRPLPRNSSILRLRQPLLRHELFNSYGIITEVIKHSDAWEGVTTKYDNLYIWFSQIDGKEYFFCEDEVTGEVVE
jgi:hypothetical protein